MANEAEELFQIFTLRHFDSVCGINFVSIYMGLYRFI